MNITLHEGYLESTKDCVSFINENYKKDNWKRKSKFNFRLTPNFGEVEIYSIRVFSNGQEFITILQDSSGIHLCKNLDLSTYVELIEKVKNVGKNFYTHDYGQIFFNPYKMKLWIVGGDGGYCYFEGKDEVIAKQFNEGGEELSEDFEEKNFHELVEGLSESDFFAEHFPDIESEYEDEQDYILIGFIKDLCCLDYEENFDDVVNPNSYFNPKPTYDIVSKNEKISELQKRMENAVRVENYELAAELRDEIKKLNT